MGSAAGSAEKIRDGKEKGNNSAIEEDESGGKEEGGENKGGDSNRGGRKRGQAALNGLVKRSKK
jgi:cryptochrome